MANKFKKGQHLFFLMNNGETSLDSQNKPRYYLSRDKAEQYKRYGSEIIEYVPVTYGVWEIMPGTKNRRFCTCCKWDVPEYGKFYGYCPNCNAKMSRGDDNDRQ